MMMHGHKNGVIIIERYKIYEGKEIYMQNAWPVQGDHFYDSVQIIVSAVHLNVLSCVMMKTEFQFVVMMMMIEDEFFSRTV